MLKAILSKLKPFLGTFQLHLDKNIEFDYFIIFKDEKNISWEILNQIGKWNYYGKKAVRGWSSLSKKDIKQFLMKHLKCNEDTIDVINANNELFHRPSEPLVILSCFNSVFSESILWFRSHHFFD